MFPEACSAGRSFASIMPRFRHVGRPCCPSQRRVRPLPTRMSQMVRASRLLLIAPVLAGMAFAPAAQAQYRGGYGGFHGGYGYGGRGYYGGHGYGRGFGFGPGIVAGALLGIAGGAALGYAAAPPPVYYARPPVVYAPPPIYYAAPPAYYPGY